MNYKTLVLRAALTFILGFVPPARSATFTVTDSSNDGPGTLRQALRDAASTPGVDLISISNLSGKINITAPLPRIDNTIIRGPGARYLTLATPPLTLGSGKTAEICGLRLIPGPPEIHLSRLGGIISNAGTLLLKESELAFSKVPVGSGGAIYNLGQLVISGCTFASNEVASFGQIYPSRFCVSAHGGALFLESGNAWVTNSTFSGNAATSFDYCSGTGGAVYLKGGDATFVNCTFVDNRADYGPDLMRDGGRLTTINNLHLYASTGSTEIGPLRDNGGPTLTHALLGNSRAIDSGVEAGAPAIDQRGQPRPQEAGWDLGAFEFVRPPGTFRLAIRIEGTGSVTKDPDLVFVPANDVVTLAASAAEDYALDGWTGGGDDSQQNPLPVRMDRDRTVTAIFAYRPLTISNAPGATNFVFNLDPWGAGSLRQAIRNLNASGGGVIRFSNTTGTVRGVLPALLSRFNFVGPTSGLIEMPQLSVAASATGRIANLKFRGTTIANRGSIALQRVVISDALSPPLENYGEMRLSQCVVSNNSSAAVSDGNFFARDTVFVSNGVSQAHATGGAMSIGGNSRFERCYFLGNEAHGGHSDGTGLVLTPAGSGYGGAIYNSGGTLDVIDTYFLNNSVWGGSGTTDLLAQFATSGAGAYGGAIYVRGGTVGLTNCAFVDNRALGGHGYGGSRQAAAGGLASGGGIYLDSGSLTIANCTIASNYVQSGNSGGGGMNNSGSATDSYGGAIGIVNGSLTLVSSTIVGNSALGGRNRGIVQTVFGVGMGGGIALMPDPRVNPQVGNAVIGSAIISGNSGSTMGTNSLRPDDVRIPGRSTGFNLIFAPQGEFQLSSSDLVTLDPRLGPLQDNGGPTPTFALLAGSPALDAGSSTATSVDQRGQPRTIDNPRVTNRSGSDGTDIGALEVDHVLRMAGIVVNRENVLVKFTSVSDKTYGLEYRTTPGNGGWSRLPLTVSGTGGIVTATNGGSGPADSMPRFYRAFEVPR